MTKMSCVSTAEDSVVPHLMSDVHGVLRGLVVFDLSTNHFRDRSRNAAAARRAGREDQNALKPVFGNCSFAVVGRPTGFESGP